MVYISCEEFQATTVTHFIVISMFQYHMGTSEDIVENQNLYHQLARLTIQPKVTSVICVRLNYWNVK